MNVGQKDAEETLSEIHERERKAFETSMEHQQAIITNILADAGKDFAKSDVYKSLGFAIQAATVLAGVMGVREVMRRW